jgi:hypothetical protein
MVTGRELRRWAGDGNPKTKTQIDDFFSFLGFFGFLEFSIFVIHLIRGEP